MATAPRALNAPDVLAVLRALRWSSVGWGLLAVLGAYLAAWEVFRQRGWALVTAAIFAFFPTFMHLTSAFTNDIGAVALGTLILWRALRLLRVEASPWDMVWLGLLLGVGILIKISVALLAPTVGLGLLLEAAGRPRPLRRLIGHGLLLGAIAGVLAGPWLAFGWLTFDDPFGFRTHVNALSIYDPPLSIPQVVPLLPEVYLSYVGKFGASVYLRPLTYTVLAGLLLLAGSGYAVYGWAHRRAARLGWLWRTSTGRQILVLAAAALGLLAGLLRWLQSIRFITGRLLYPAHLCTALLIAGGLYLLARRAPRVGWVARVAVVGGLAAVSLIGTPLAIQGAYQAPHLLAADELPALQGAPLDFAGTLRLLGYQQAERRVNPGGTGGNHPVLGGPAGHRSIGGVRRQGGRCRDDCGQPHVLVGDGPLSQPVVAARRPLVRPGLRAAGRDARPGPGLRRAGGSAGRRHSGLQLARRHPRRHAGRAALHRPGDQPSRKTWPSRLTSRRLRRASSFPGFAALDGVALRGEVAAGQDVTLDLAWRVKGQTTDDWQQFVHLIGPAETTPLAGGPPREGAYPTWAWATGERVADSWTLHLPEDLPPGDYALGLGFFLAESGARMPALEGGAPAQDNVAIVARFHLD